MNNKNVVLAVVIVLVVVIAGYFIFSQRSSAPTVNTGTQQTPQNSSGDVMSSNNASLGNILVDKKGMTLYLFTKDSVGTSTCYGQCATNWPPLIISGTPSAGTPVDSAKISSITRTDGTKQVTYGGMPLYYYFKDQKSGDTFGQGINNVWFVIRP